MPRFSFRSFVKFLAFLLLLVPGTACKEASGDYYDALPWTGRWAHGVTPGTSALVVRVLIPSQNLPGNNRREEAITGLRAWETAFQQNPAPGIAPRLAILPEGDTDTPADITVGEREIQRAKTYGHTQTRAAGGGEIAPGTQGQIGNVVIWIGTATETGYVAITACHEMGHALGLSGHSNDKRDALYAPGERATPSLRDRNTLARIYTDAPP